MVIRRLQGDGFHEWIANARRCPMLTNKVSEIMTTNITTAVASQTVFEAMEKMVSEDVGRIVITDRDVCVGTVTEKDVLRRVVNKLAAKKSSISKLMTSQFRAVLEDTHTVEAFGKRFK